MKSIKLLGMELEGFRSFRDVTTIEFSQSTGLKFLSGDNRASPRLGANGAGKSTLWDAVAYCLTGASVKGIRASNLLSWGSKAIWVQCVFTVNDEVVVVERQGMPDRLFIDDQPVDQAAVDHVFGLTRQRFLQSVIFGQSVPLFIDLSGPERGLLLDEVLDLGIWLKAADAASKRHAEASKAVEQCERDLAFLRGKQAGSESLEAIEAAMASWQGEQDGRIEVGIREVERIERELDELVPKIASTTAAVSALPDIASVNKELSRFQTELARRETEYQGLFKEFQRLQNAIKFYDLRHRCPECDQEIPGHHKMNKIAELTKKKNDTERSIRGNGAMQTQFRNQTQALSAEREKLSRKREFLIQQQATVAEEYRALKRVLDAAINAVEKMAEATNPHEARKAKLLADRADTEAKVNEANKVRRRVATVVSRTEFWRAAFKRVRLFMVKRVLAQLQAETASAALALGLAGWTILFTTEVETKSGTTKTGIHITVASPQSTAPWEAWSGGEGQRVRLAVALGLASLIQRMAGVSFNFEVFDEPTAFLAAEGIDDLMECLSHRAQVLNKSIWLCDHRALTQASFAEIWSVYKDVDGSHMQLLSNLS